jgi:hypothetical protein
VCGAPLPARRLRSRAGWSSCTTANLGQGIGGLSPSPPASSSEQRCLPWFCAYMVWCTTVEMTSWSSSAWQWLDAAIAMVLGCYAGLGGDRGGSCLTLLCSRLSGNVPCSRQRGGAEVSQLDMSSSLGSASGP